jgi:hypothetical protein
LVLALLCGIGHRNSLSQFPLHAQFKRDSQFAGTFPAGPGVGWFLGWE